MASAARRSGGAVGTGMLEGVYRLVMRRTPIYVTFVLVGAFFGERAVDYGVHKLWERNNIGRGTRIFQYLERGKLKSEEYEPLAFSSP